MTSALIHRGPDQQGHYWGKDIALGAVRLKVIDLEGGNQPLQDEASQTVIAFNGEIYTSARCGVSSRRAAIGFTHSPIPKLPCMPF